MKCHNKNMENGFNKLKKTITTHQAIRQTPKKLSDIKTFYLPTKNK
jgi:hypothetical protein